MQDLKVTCICSFESLTVILKFAQLLPFLIIYFFIFENIADLDGFRRKENDLLYLIDYN